MSTAHRRSLGRGSLIGVCSLVALAGGSYAQSAGSPHGAGGQPTIIRRTASAPGPALPPAAPAPLSQERFTRYAKTLKLDADQTTAAQALYDSYVSQVQQSQKTLREKIKEANEDDGGIVPLPSGSGSAKLESLGAIMRETSEKTKALRDQFLSDLKSLLHAEQAGNWSALERLRRRDNYLSRGSLSGSTLDLLSIVDAMKLTDAERQPLATVLEDYELNLDRALQDRERLLEPQDNQTVQTFEAGGMKARMDKEREVDLKVKGVSVAAARQCAELVPSERRGVFEDLVKRATYRSVYKTPSAARKVEAAQKLKSLSPAQQTKLSDALARYQQDAALANQRWADAIAKAEADGRPTGSGFMIMGGKLDPELSDARKARRELDNALSETLKSTLTPEQMDELPTTPAQGGVAGRAVSVHAFSDGSGAPPVTIMTEEDLDDEDAVPVQGGPAIIIINDQRTGDGSTPPQPTAPSNPPPQQP